MTPEEIKKIAAERLTERMKDAAIGRAEQLINLIGETTKKLESLKEELRNISYSEVDLDKIG